MVTLSLTLMECELIQSHEYFQSDNLLQHSQESLNSLPPLGLSKLSIHFDLSRSDLQTLSVLGKDGFLSIFSLW